MTPVGAKDEIDAFFARHLVAWVDAVQRRAWQVTTAILLLTLALLGYSVLNLRVNSNNVDLVAEDLPARVNHERFARLFPNLENALLLVIDGKTPELARTAAIALAADLTSQTQAFEDVYLPGGGEFFERNGLLYRSPEELDQFGDQIARIQPILAALEQDPSISNMSSLIIQGLEMLEDGGSVMQSWPDVLERVGDATVAVYSEYPLAISWEELLLKGSAIESVTRRVVVAHPILDFDNVLAAGPHLDLIHESAARLGLEEKNGIRVRVTGNPALNYEELISIAWEVGLGGVICFLVVVGILYRALRSLRLVTACVLTLLVGLVWTAAFAAAAIGHVNIVSMAFAVLFIGLGVDFGIHLSMRYGDLLRDGLSNEDALRGATQSVGSSLLICAISTAIGFMVFVPTQYLGIAELGLIAGTGMFIILFQTLTLFPALLTCCLKVDPDSLLGREFRFRRHWWNVFQRVPGAVVAVACLAGIASLWSLPRLRFDPNVINMRDPSTESVQAFNDLLAQAGTASPWFVNSVARNLEEASERAARFRAHDQVDRAITLEDYIPADQDLKLEIIEDVAFMMDSPGGKGIQREVSLDEQVRALRSLHDFLDDPAMRRDQSPLNVSIDLLRRRLADFLARVDEDESPEAALASLESILLSTLPEQVERLRSSLTASPIGLEDLPDQLVARMITPDGQARIQVYPSETLQTPASFRRFTDAVMEIDPKAAGVAINLVEFGRATRDSFRQALISAFLVIFALLWLLWRRLTPVALALSPLLLSSVLICAVMAVFDLPFQFANIVVIPLLLGVGIDSGIHLVHRAENLEGESEELMKTTTARAVYYSAITTTVSFGTLSFSDHQGLSSLGILLGVGMLITVTCNLIFLPALLQLRQRRQLRQEDRDGLGSEC